MTSKEYFKTQNTFKKIYKSMKEAHPDWSHTRLYMTTKGQLIK